MSQATFKNSQNRYIPSFDSLRGLSAFFVLLLHGSYGFFKGGWIGVDLFFVLSGYLITSLLQKEYINRGDISLSKFYTRRALRLFPPLIVGVLMANVLWSFTILFPDANRQLATIGALFYFTNFLKGNVAGNLAHLWSLCVEEHFYLLWPVTLIIFFEKLSFRRQAWFLLSLIFSITAIKIVVYNFEDLLQYKWFRIDPNRFTFCRMEGIIMGAFLALVVGKYKVFDKHKEDALKEGLLILLLFVIFIMLLFTLSENNVYWRNGGFILTNLLCTFTVYVALRCRFHPLFSNRLLNWVGKRSYGIYVYHFPIFLVSEGLRQEHNLSNFLLVTACRFGLSVAFAALSFKYIEQPILKVKNRFQGGTV
jgi:peptidoglycan/LPS O-acetylase OafA/YrhL